MQCVTTNQHGHVSYHELSVIDPKTGTNIIVDIIGNAGSLSPDHFALNEEGWYACPEYVYDWWHDWALDHQALIDRIHALKTESDIDDEDVENALADIDVNDLENFNLRANEALDEAFGHVKEG